MIDEYTNLLLKAEASMLFKNRHTIGDASETAMVKFAQAIESIDESRSAHPVYSYNNGKQNVNVQIPFDSRIKFNVMVRDMEP